MQKRIFVAALGMAMLASGLIQVQAGEAKHASRSTSAEQSDQPANPLQSDNPTGLRACEMRPDGLMINGLLPAPGWQG